MDTFTKLLIGLILGFLLGAVYDDYRTHDLVAQAESKAVGATKLAETQTRSEIDRMSKELNAIIVKDRAEFDKNLISNGAEHDKNLQRIEKEYQDKLQYCRNTVQALVNPVKK